MANLITTQQHGDIRGALQDVIDTFFTTDVEYRLQNEEAHEFADGEMMNPDMPYTVYNLKAQPKYYSGEGSVSSLNETTAGAQDITTVDLLFGHDDLLALGLIVDNKPVMEIERDEFVLHGEIYKVTLVNLEAFFQPNSVLVRVRGRIRAKRR